MEEFSNLAVENPQERAQVIGTAYPLAQVTTLTKRARAKEIAVDSRTIDYFLMLTILLF